MLTHLKVRSKVNSRPIGLIFSRRLWVIYSISSRPRGHFFSFSPLIRNIAVDDKQPLTIDFCIAAVKPTNAASALTTPGALGKPLEDAKWADLKALSIHGRCRRSTRFSCAPGRRLGGGHTARTEDCIDHHLFLQRAAKLQNKHLAPNPSESQTSHLAAKFKANTARRTYREKLLPAPG